MSRKLLFTWKRIIAATGPVLVLCLAGLTVFVKYQAGPEYARKRFEQEVSNFWTGRLKIEDVRLDLSGRAHFEGVAFLDNQSRVWVHAATIIATLGNWPRPTVYLRAVDVDKLDISLHADTTRATFPLKSRSQEPVEYERDRALSKVTVSDGSLEAIGRDKRRIHLGRLTVQVDRIKDSYEIASSLEGTEESKDIGIQGTLDAVTSRVDFSLTVDRTITSDESAFLVTLLGRPENISVAGRLTGGVSVEGKLNDRANIAIRGEMQCKNTSLSIGDKTMISDMKALVGIDGNRLDLKEFFASCCNGTIRSTVSIDDYTSKSMGISGNLQADEIDLAELISKGDDSRQVREGKGSLKYSFTAENMNLSTLSGRGEVIARDADILPMPLLTKISTTVGLGDKEMQATSDAIAEFTNEGLVFTVEHAYLTNRHAAFAVEPGGIIDANDRTFDMHVNAVQLKSLSDFMRKVPVVTLFVGLSDKLTRLRVKGRWTDPASELIRKEPITDLKEGIAEFFLGAARSGGKLTDSIREAGRDIINGSEKPD